MQQIRQGTWETNSSSIHAVCIHKQENLALLNYIFFGLEDLDSDIDYRDIQERANYMNTIMYMCLSKTEYINRQKHIKDILKGYGIRVEWAKVHWNEGGEPNYDLYSIKDSCVEVILDKVTQNELLLLQFLFGANSTIIAGYEDTYTERLHKYQEKHPEGKEYVYLYDYED